MTPTKSHGDTPARSGPSLLGVQRDRRAAAHLRARVIIFIASLLILSVQPIAWIRLPVACAVYLLVVLPVLR